MGKIEELPDDFDESLNIDDGRSKQNPGSLREMYEKRLDNAEAFSSKSFEEILYDMSKTPIFMDSTDVANAGMQPTSAL